MRKAKYLEVSGRPTCRRAFSFVADKQTPDLAWRERAAAADGVPPGHLPSRLPSTGLV